MPDTVCLAGHSIKKPKCFVRFYLEGWQRYLSEYLAGIVVGVLEQRAGSRQRLGARFVRGERVQRAVTRRRLRFQLQVPAQWATATMATCFTTLLLLHNQNRAPY